VFFEIALEALYVVCRVYRKAQHMSITKQSTIPHLDKNELNVYTIRKMDVSMRFKEDMPAWMGNQLII